jgi:ankyrin repeat protein
MKKRSLVSVLLIMLLLVSLVTASEIFDTVKKGDITKVTEIIKKNPKVVNEKNDEGETPLFIAAEEGNSAVAELLISRGADVNSKNNEGETPLFVAAEEGNRAVVELLISRGADVNIKNNEGKTVITEVKEESSQEKEESYRDIIEMLKKHKAME